MRILAVITFLLDWIPQMLEAQSECQVLEFLCSYLSSTVLDSCTVQALLDQVRTFLCLF